jgi:integrase
MVLFPKRTDKKAMANKTVGLYRKVKTADGWKRYPAVMSANGKVKPDTVVVQGFERVFRVGHYELRSYAGTKSIWTRIQGNATDALAALNLAKKRANAIAVADDAGVQIVTDPKRMSIKEARAGYFEAAQARGALETAEVVDRALSEFQITCPKIYVDQIVREDVTKFQAAMRKQGLSDRTVYNRHMNLRSFILFCGGDAEVVCGPAPRFEEQTVEIYEPEDLKPFFAVEMKEYDRLLFGVLLAAGLREREAMHLEWNSINWTARTLRVQSNSRWKFKVKDSEQRNVPLPEDLLARLLVYREGHREHRLVFGKRGGEDDAPDGHLLRRLKTIVRNAGLNCNECPPCIENGECEHWYLHKFRATCITTLLRNGLDLRTVMHLSGHSDLESVIRYLRPAEGLAVQAAVNAIRWC